MSKLFKQQAYDLTIDPYSYSINATYDGMKQVCARNGMDICKSTDICPNGKPKSNLLTFGFSDNWIAVGDSQNEWITLNPKDNRMCKTHTQIAGTKPEWGNNPANRSNFFRAVKCCPRSSTTETQQSTQSYDLRIKPNVSTGEAAYNNMAKMCTDKGMKLCNKDEFCVNGNPKSQYDVFGQEDNWIAVGDSQNEWLTLNRAGNRLCKTHTEVAGTKPEWGLGTLPANFNRAAKCCPETNTVMTKVQRCEATIYPGGHIPDVTWGNVPQSEQDFWNNNNCKVEICKSYANQGYTPGVTFGSLPSTKIEIAKKLDCDRVLRNLK